MPNITLNSVQYFYQAQCKRSATNPALVLLHGSGGDSSVWTAQIEALSENHHVIAADLPGHGQSQGNPARKPQEYANWLKELITSLNLAPFVLVGHSLGSIIAQLFACMFPEKLRGLVLIGSGMRFEIQSDYLEIVKHDFSAACLLSCKEAYASQPHPTQLAQGLSMLQNNGPEILLSDLSLCNNFDNSTRAHTLTMPCLVMCGKKDTITPCTLSEELTGAIPNSILKVIEASGHMLMQEKPDECNNEISSFVHTYCSHT